MTSVPIRGSADSKSGWECVCVCVCCKGTCTVLGSLRISNMFLTMESIKNFLNLPCHYFDLESKRTHFRCPAGQGLCVAPCPVGLHPYCWRGALLGPEWIHGNQEPWEAVKEIMHQKSTSSLSAPSSGALHQGGSRSLQKNVLPDSGLACGR